MFLLLLACHYADLKNSDDKNDDEFIPDEIELYEEDLEFEVAALDRDIVKINYISPSANPQSFDSSMGLSWSDQPPNIDDLNEFLFEETILGATDVDLTEIDIFNTIFTENILNQ